MVGEWATVGTCPARVPYPWRAPDYARALVDLRIAAAEAVHLHPQPASGRILALNHKPYGWRGTGTVVCGGRTEGNALPNVAIRVIVGNAVIAEGQASGPGEATLAVGQLRIVLTWGVTPRDLDRRAGVPGP
jgi:hypothetical protein